MAAAGSASPALPELPASERATPVGTFHSVYRRDLFAGRVALVTGGGTGIGLRIAREIVWLGGSVMLASRKRAVLDAAVARIHADLKLDADAASSSSSSSPSSSASAAGKQPQRQPLAKRVSACELNIRDAASARACVAATLAEFGRLDYLVNNAGGQFPSPAENISEKGWHAVLDTNLTGTFLMCGEAFRQAFAPANSGAIVNIIANMARGMPVMAHTGAARAGVDNLTKSLAVEWARAGVRINSIAPGVIVSDGLDRYPAHFKESMFSRLHTMAYAWRPGTTAEVASAVMFLLSDGASFVTGQTLYVDGGEVLMTAVWPPVAHGNLPAFTDAFEAATPAAAIATSASASASASGSAAAKPKSAAEPAIASKL